MAALEYLGKLIPIITSSDDILKALQPPLWQQAREFIGAYARHVASTLPHVTGEGETMVDCRYDEASRVMTTTFEYAGMYWPDVRQYLEENMGAVRKERALALVADTATSLAFAAYKGDVDVALYDVIFIGGPIWWGTYPQVMFTFFQDHDLSGKTVIPFTTHEGSGLASTVQDVKKAWPKATVKDGFAIYGHEVRSGRAKVEKWLRGSGW